MPRWLLLLPLIAAPLLPAADPTKPRSFEVPYKTTVPKHIVVRVKINKKGPFNFILDTGAPAMIIATKVGDKAGLVTGDDGWAVMDRLEIEGGPVILKSKARVETPFQLEGMNGLGLAGLEIHGLMGYHVLARYRMVIDFTRDKMTWTEVDYDLPTPGRIGKGGGAGGLEMMGTIMKGLGGVLGRKPTPDVTLRGFVGLTLENGDEAPTVTALLAGGPAGVAGVRKGDAIVKVNGRTVVNVGDVLRLMNRQPAGGEVTLRVKRKDGEMDITFKTGEGI